MINTERLLSNSKHKLTPWRFSNTSNNKITYNDIFIKYLGDTTYYWHKRLYFPCINQNSYQALNLFERELKRH